MLSRHKNSIKTARVGRSRLGTALTPNQTMEQTTTSLAVPPSIACAPNTALIRVENPNSPKVVLDAQSRAIYFSRSVIPYLRGVPREEWLARHTFYKHIGLYAFRADVLRAVTALPQSPLELAESLEQLRWLENGYKIGVGISEVETIGIDTPEDLEKAERFLQLKIKNEE